MPKYWKKQSSRKGYIKLYASKLKTSCTLRYVENKGWNVWFAGKYNKQQKLTHVSWLKARKFAFGGMKLANKKYVSDQTAFKW